RQRGRRWRRRDGRRRRRGRRRQLRDPFLGLGTLGVVAVRLGEELFVIGDRVLVVAGVAIDLTQVEQVAGAGAGVVRLLEVVDGIVGALGAIGLERLVGQLGGARARRFGALGRTGRGGEAQD